MEPNQEQSEEGNSVEWYYVKDGKQFGAVSQTQIIELLKDSILSPGSLVWKQGLSDWQKASNTELVSYLIRSEPPPLPLYDFQVPPSATLKPPASSTAKGRPWLPAFGFFIGAAVQGFVIGVIHSDNLEQIVRSVNNNDLWYIPFLVSIGFNLWDETQLAKANVDTSKFRQWVSVPPAYLYWRAKALNHSQVYCAVWLILIFLHYA